MKLPDDWTEFDEAEDRRLFGENAEIRVAIAALTRRQEQDAEFLILLKMGIRHGSVVGGFAHTAAIAAARAINGEAS